MHDVAMWRKTTPKPELCECAAGVLSSEANSKARSSPSSKGSHIPKEHFEHVQMFFATRKIVRDH